MTIAEKIYKLRTDIGLSQKEFADKVGTSQSAINYWENGKRQPRTSQIKKIAKTFDIALYILIDDKYSLDDITSEAWKNKARFVGDTEMVKPPIFTAPISSSSIDLHANSDSINWNQLDDKQQARFERINEKLNCGKEITIEEKKFRLEYMKQALKKVSSDTAKRIQNAYNQLNQEGKLRAAEQVELLTKIPEYQKEPDEPPQD